MKNLMSAIVAALPVCLAVQASAAPINIVQDPGFEAAGSTGYIDSPNFLPDGVWQQTLGSGFVENYTGGSSAHSGSIDYAPNAIGGSNATVQQLLTTTAGQAYDLTFYYTLDRNGPITVTFGGVPVAFNSTLSNKNYYMATATGLVANGTSTALDFSAIGANTELDDVSVTASVPVATSVPEPASLALLGMGVVGFGVARRRKAA